MRCRRRSSLAWVLRRQEPLDDMCSTGLLILNQALKLFVFTRNTPDFSITSLIDVAEYTSTPSNTRHGQILKTLGSKHTKRPLTRGRLEGTNTVLAVYTVHELPTQACYCSLALLQRDTQPTAPLSTSFFSHAATHASNCGC